jgi:hypothetical protein
MYTDADITSRNRRLEGVVPFVLDSIVFLIVGMLLGLVLMRTFGKPGDGARASVKLVRTARTADGREETRLFVNDAAILTATNDGIRLAEYADEVEQLEAVAARLAASLGVTVEFARVGARTLGGENGIPVRSLPSDQTLSEPQDEDLETRRARLDNDQAGRG